MIARILVIEDVPANLELMRYLLAASGHEVLLAEDGTTGLALALAERPDLILCDVQLPGMNGFEVVAKLARDPVMAATPVIAVTASAMSGDRENIIASGFHEYLSKPINPEIFVAQVERMLTLAKSAPKDIP